MDSTSPAVGALHRCIEWAAFGIEIEGRWPWQAAAAAPGGSAAETAAPPSPH